MEKIYFIINPQAKNGYSKRVWKLVERELSNSNIPFTALFTERAGHATDLVREISRDMSEENKFIIAVGGDGTLHEVVNGAIGSVNVYVGFIPGGSGNDFRRGYGIPKKPLSALHFALEEGKNNPTPVDVGTILDAQQKQTYFINNMGVGFDALITKEANGSRLKKILNRFSLGNLIYAYLVVRRIFSFKLSNVALTVDGIQHHFDQTWFVTISNQPYYGGGMKIAPDASAVDGEFNVTVVHRLSRLKFLLFFVSVFWGGHVGFKEVKQMVGKKITIETEIPLYVHADGECIGESPVIISVNKKVLPLLIKKID